MSQFVPYRVSAVDVRPVREFISRVRNLGAMLTEAAIHEGPTEAGRALGIAANEVEVAYLELIAACEGRHGS